MIGRKMEGGVWKLTEKVRQKGWISERESGAKPVIYCLADHKRLRALVIYDAITHYRRGRGSVAGWRVGGSYYTLMPCLSPPPPPTIHAGARDMYTILHSSHKTWLCRVMVKFSLSRRHATLRETQFANYNIMYNFDTRMYVRYYNIHIVMHYIVHYICLCKCIYFNKSIFLVG